MALFKYLFCGIWALLGIIFSVIGFFLRRHALRVEERCTRRAEATVIEVIRHRHHSQHGSSYSWHPLVEFDYEGRKVQLESSSGAGRKKYYEGQVLNIFHDPDDPSVFFVEGNRPDKIVGTVFKWVGLGMVIFAAATFMMLGMVVL